MAGNFTSRYVLPSVSAGDGAGGRIGDRVVGSFSVRVIVKVA